MGIKTKIIFGFTLLIISIISVVSFWAAQSLGFTIESSDLKKLNSFRDQISNKLHNEEQSLLETSKSLSSSLSKINILKLSYSKKIRVAEKLRTSLALDWIELLHNNVSLIYPTIRLFNNNSSQSDIPVRLTDEGPLSFGAFLSSNLEIPGKSYRLLTAKKINLDDIKVPLFCLWDNKGVVQSKNFKPSSEILSKFSNSFNTIQMYISDQLFRLRAYKLGENFHLLVGYPAQKTSISKTSINQLMLRIAVIEVLGLLILGYFLGNRLFSPLSALQHGIEQVGKGKWDEIPLDKPPMKGSGEEIETVALSFNKMVRDLSTAQKQLIEVQKELAQKEKMAALGRFAGSIAHEINNPLGTILVSAGMIKEAVNKKIDIENEDIELIIDEVKRCKDIIMSLRTYTTRSRSNLKLCSFKQIFTEVLDKVRKTSTNNFDIVQVDSPIDCDVMLDKTAFYQLLQNVVTNAFEATQNIPQPLIKIEFDKTNEYIEILIKDNGLGFNCPTEHVFEPLMTTKPLGTGLGLAICQVIIDGHNGKIEAKRLESDETQFRILLPLVQKKER